MIVYINNTEHSVQESTFLHSLLSQTPGSFQSGVAIAVNNKVITRSNWGSYTLQEGDHVLIIKASQGG